MNKKKNYYYVIPMGEYYINSNIFVILYVDIPYTDSQDKKMYRAELTTIDENGTRIIKYRMSGQEIVKEIENGIRKGHLHTKGRIKKNKKENK